MARISMVLLALSVVLVVLGMKNEGASAHSAPRATAEVSSATAEPSSVKPLSITDRFVFVDGFNIVVPRPRDAEWRVTEKEISFLDDNLTATVTFSYAGSEDEFHVFVSDIRNNEGWDAASYIDAFRIEKADYCTEPLHEFAYQSMERTEVRFTCRVARSKSYKGKLGKKRRAKRRAKRRRFIATTIIVVKRSYPGYVFVGVGGWPESRSEEFREVMRAVLLGIEMLIDT